MNNGAVSERVRWRLRLHRRRGDPAVVVDCVLVVHVFYRSSRYSCYSQSGNPTVSRDSRREPIVLVRGV